MKKQYILKREFVHFSIYSTLHREITCTDSSNNSSISKLDFMSTDMRERCECRTIMRYVLNFSRVNYPIRTVSI